MTAASALTRIPIRLQPLPGESFDGWLDAYSQRLKVSSFELGEALGIPAPLLHLRGANVALGHPDLDPERVAARACGIDPARVAALWFGLARYERLVAKRVGGRWLARALRPMTSSRYCPTCLRDSAGRWRAVWRLPWYLACETHETILASGCPHCGGTQRNAGLRAEYRPALMTSCSHSSTGKQGRVDHRCRHDLTAESVAWPAPFELLVLQADLVGILDQARSDSEAATLTDRLVDLLVVSTHSGLDLRAIDRDRRNTAEVLAGPLRDAFRALLDPRTARLRDLAVNDLNPMQGALPYAWRGVSPALAAALLEHRDVRLRPSDRLRYRSMTGAGRRPEGADPALRMRSMPLALWPDWAIRLRPPTIEPNNFRIAAAIALCLPGATAPRREILDRWPGPRFTNHLPGFGRNVTADPHGTAILNAICALADTLDRAGAPIDYPRRRAFASQITLIDSAAWRIMCRAAGTQTGFEPMLRRARLWLWETLTGDLPEQAPPWLSATSPDDLAAYLRFALRLPGDTNRRLLEHARGLLDVHGFNDEPVTWSPPVGDVAVNALPGPDPDRIDVRYLHHVLGQQLSPTQTAERLGITLEHLRYLARTKPPTMSPRAARTAPPTARLASRVTPDELRALIQTGHSLRRIGARFGVSHKVVHDELVAHGIPIPPRGRYRHEIKRDWLHDQYIVRLHTMAEIAAQTGASIHTISKLLRDYGIPVRPAGPASYRQNLRGGHGLPEPLASAVHGQGGADRVKRFQVFARTASLTAGAKRLGAKQHMLTQQLAQLESACGAQLIQRRTTNQRPQQPTALGLTLLDQADHHFGPHAAAPPKLPEPLAFPLASAREEHWNKIRR
ncbi:MAG: TniQ family protein [Solirubrobacteraceae bacterium]